MKEKIFLTVMIGALLAGALIFSSRRVTAQDTEPPIAPQTETQGENSRSVENITPNALTGFIVTSNPYCYQPDVSRDECTINIRYMQATDDGTTSPYLSMLEVRVDGKLRYYSNTFFESSIYYNYDMIPNGLKVTCGSPNQGGAGTDYGKVYSLTIQAKSGNGTQLGANYGSVRCPAYVP